ncbi:MAG: sensor histidine kinase [Chloroflexi bacterium]|jgi:signal transduction histidine kinase|nr:sensor histidine kinase [Chloroflexota bacterium]
MELRPIEPGLLRIFRYFTSIAMVYFAALVLYTAIQTGAGDTFPQIQSYLNFGINLILLGYLYWGWLQRKLRNYYLPLALIAATVVPIFSNLIYLAAPQEKAIDTIMRSWLLFPIMVVPLVLIAWQYRFRYVVAFILFATAVEYWVLLPRLAQINFDTLPILGAPMIRAFAFGTVGHIVTRLIDTQRIQRKQLLRANLRLSQHANTLEQLAISRERNRLARELHDTLAHTLSGLAVNLEAIKIVLGEASPEARQMLNHALKNTRTGLNDTRRALKDLRAKSIEDLGLNIAIRNLAHDAAARAGFSIHINIENQFPDLPPDTEQALYRIAQESLENIVKHAAAENVSVSLTFADNLLVLLIADDGRGGEFANLDLGEKHGLRGMRERAAGLGAALEVSSTPKEGTQIQVTLEIPDD